MKDDKETHFYDEIYGISKLSPRYWWRRRSRHRVLFATLFLLAVAAPIALAIWWPSLQPWFMGRYHDLRARGYLASAHKFLAAGDPASARIDLQNALRHRPGDADALLAYARSMRSLDQGGYALWALQAHTARPDDPRTATIALGYAIEENQTEVADFLLRDSLPRFPKDAGIRVLASHHLMRKGNPAAALRLANEAKTLAPQNAEAAFLVASLSSRSVDAKTRAAAIGELGAYRERPQFRTRASWALVNALSRAEPRTALAILEDLIREEKTPWQARERRLVISSRIDPATPAEGLADLWSAADTPAKRLSLIETAESLDPEHARKFLDALPEDERRALPALLSQFRLWARAKDWRRVADAATRASQTDSVGDRVILTLWLARANREIGEEAAAMTCLRTALTRCEGDPMLALRAAMQLERLALRDAAIPFYELVIAKAPGRTGAFAQSRLAAVRHAGGRTDEMLKTWEEALSKNPRDPQAMNNVASCLLLLNRDIPRALKLSSEAHAARPASAFFGDTHALALAASGRAAEALALHAKLPASRLRQPDFALNYATVLDLAGRNSEALALVSNLNASALLPEQIAVRQRILGIETAPAESLLLSPSKMPDEPPIPATPQKPLGPTPDGPGLPEFMPLPPIGDPPTSP